LNSVIGTADLSTLGKDTLLTATFEVFLPHPAKPPVVEHSAARPHFPKNTSQKRIWGISGGFGNRIFGKTGNIIINFIALFVENIEPIQ